MSVEKSPKIIASYIAVYLFVIGITFYLTMNYWPQTNIGSMKKVRIDHGTTLSTISDKLSRKGLVSNKWVFEFLTKIKGLEKSMQAGIFRISNVHTNNDVINNIEDASYAKLRELSLSYNFGKINNSYLGNPGVIVRLSAQDLITWTKYSGWDPETNMYQDRISGEDYFNQPQTWRANLALQLNW